MPSARNARYSSDIRSARMKSLHGSRSHWPSRRSSELVAYTSAFCAKNAASCGGSRNVVSAPARIVSRNDSGVYG